MRDPQVNRQQIQQPLYDFKEIEGGGRYDFFDMPIGTIHADQTGVGNSGYCRTNMYLSGRLPSENQFVLTGIRVMFFPGESTFDNMQLDRYRVYSSGCLRLMLGNREYLLLGPLGLFPPMIDILPMHKKKFSRKTLQKNNYFELSRPIFFGHSDVFQATVTLDKVLRLHAKGRLGVMLDGQKIRDEQ
jgi:hypothetical protein